MFKILKYKEDYGKNKQKNKKQDNVKTINN